MAAIYSTTRRPALYKWYSFEDSSALNKILVKTPADDPEPKDIATVSGVVRSLRDAERIQRVYASDEDQVNTLRKIMREEIQQ